MLGLSAVAQRAVAEVGSLAPGSVQPAYTVEVEFVAGSYTNISGNVLRFDVSRSLSTMFTGLLEGRLSVNVENTDGEFSPGNTGGAYYPNLVPGKRVRVRGHYSGAVYELFNGRVVDFAFNPSVDDSNLMIEATDSIRRLKNTTINTSLFTNTNPGSLFTDVVTQCAVNSFTADSFSDSIPYVWFRDVQAGTAIGRLLEFGRYLFYENAAGTIKLNNRQWGQTFTSVATFSSASTDGFASFNYALSDNTIINQAKVEATPRFASTTQNTVAWLSENLTIAASGAVGFWLSYVDPVEPTVFTPATSLQTPVNSTDYTANTASGGGGTDRTATLSLSITMFGAAAVCSLFNGSGDTVYVTKFQIRGFSVRESPALSYQDDVTSSQNLYGVRAIALNNEYMGTQQYVKDYITSLLLDKNNAQPKLSMSRRNDFPNILDLDVGDVVSLVQSRSGVNSQWLVTGVSHAVTMDPGIDHLAGYEVEQLIDRQVLILDHASFGVLDSRKLSF